MKPPSKVDFLALCFIITILMGTMVCLGFGMVYLKGRQDVLIDIQKKTLEIIKEQRKVILDAGSLEEDEPLDPFNPEEPF